MLHKHLYSAILELDLLSYSPLITNDIGRRSSVLIILTHFMTHQVFLCSLVTDSNIMKYDKVTFTFNI